MPQTKLRTPTDFKLVEAVFDGKYEVLKVIGQGGMSFVYLAMDKRLNKQWAIKEIQKEGSDQNGKVVQTLMTEANLMKRLDHPAIPRIIDIIENQMAIYVVMDYIEGDSLDKVLDKFGPQPQDVVIDWTMQLADALNYLHNQNPPIIYRDMKPANVMLKPEGTVKLIDFGTAREYKGMNTSDTIAFGTQGFAAPEQYGKRETDGRTDIFCLGMTMHNLLTGKNPSDENYEYYPVRVWRPDVHEGIERVIERCVRPDRESRFQNCSELMYALEHYEEDTEAYKNAQRKKVKMFFGTLILSGVMLLTSVGTYFGAQITKNNDYDDLISISEAASLDSKVDAYITAIDLKTDRLDAYVKLVEAYNKDLGVGEFSRSESDILAANLNKYNGDKTDEEYLDLLYNVGLLYFGGYMENGSAGTKARMIKSSDYFAQLHEILKDDDLDFENRSVAECYYTITTLYMSSQNTMGYVSTFSKEQCKEMLDAIEECLYELESMNRSTTYYENTILGQCETMANLLNDMAASFCDGGIPESRVTSLLKDIRSCLNNVKSTALQYEAETVKANCDRFIDNIHDVYLR